MKLFIYDEKHERINNELDLEDISESEREVVNKIIDFLEENNITDRYKKLVLAKEYKLVQNDDFQEIEFS